MSPVVIPLAKRLAAKIFCRGPQDCWLWQGAKNNQGYGKISVGGRKGYFIAAHRAAYQLAKGEIPDGLFVLHTCDTPACCNPAHLKVGTHKDNMRDMVAKKRHSKRRQDGQNNGNAKLTWAKVKKIRASSRTQKYLGQRYGVSCSTISQIKLNYIWKEKL